MAKHYNHRITHLNDIRKKLINTLYGLDGDSEVLSTSLREVNMEINIIHRLEKRVCYRKEKINRLLK